MGGRCIGFALGLALPLCGCGAVDSQLTFVPASFRQPAPGRAETERPPDVHLVVRNNISNIFMAAASPTNIYVTAPIRANDSGWATCVKAGTIGVTGGSIGTLTYLVKIEHDAIGEHERVGETHWCAKQTFQPL
jgi:hypothetical protein